MIGENPGQENMAAQAQAAYGIYPERTALNDVLNTLNHGGFHDENICMMLSPAHPIASVVRDANVLNAEREENVATAGLIGWLAKFGAVVIPTVGFFIRSPKFFHAVLAEKGPMARCGGSRTLVGLGFPEHEAERFETRLRDVGVLVYVSCRENAKTEWALELLRGTGAEEAGTLESEELAAV
jgi:hypothetical protein